MKAQKLLLNLKVIVMNNIYKFKKYKNYVILTLVLGLFILLFYFLSCIYTLNSKKTKTVILESRLFTSNQSNDKIKNICIENVRKNDIPYFALSYSILGNDSVIFGTNEKIYALDIDNNNLIEIYKINTGYLNNIVVSGDGKKVIYSYIDIKKNVGKTGLYNVETKSNIEIMDNASHANLIINNNKYIGISDHYLFMKDLNTGEVNNLISIDEIYSLRNKDTQSNKYNGRYELISSKDGNMVYYIYQTTKSNGEIYSTILQVNLKNKGVSKKLIKGNVYDFQLLDDGNFIFCGNIEGSSGIFIYNVKNKTHKNLKQGKILGIEMSKDNKKIAYNISTSNGISELHAAFFNKDKIGSDTTVYSSSKYGTRLKWDGDRNSLFYFVSNSNGDTIYKFSFKS